ncbi:MAG TPA: MFS transporter [Deltaproteobacteria bacterium]|nr:MFS transporter [Deltaproteobacteria bacterium]
MIRTRKKSIAAWAMYDWANSAFATTIMAGFFPIFFKQFWSLGVDPTVSTARLGMANSLAGIIVAVSAPVLGAIADAGSSKKKFLLFFACMGVVMTSSLYMVSKGNWLMAVALYVFATIGFSGGNVFYDALLPSVSQEKKMDVISALGFSLGYLGGGLLFAVNVWMTLRPHMFGFADAGVAVRFSFLTVGLWWAVFSIPLLLFVKEPRRKDSVPAGIAIRQGCLQIVRTFKEVKYQKTIFLFLLAYWLYIDGVDTIIRMAVDYGLSLGFESTDLIGALLITQFVGFPCAIAFGFIGEKIGAKRAIFIAIGVYLFISIWAAFMQSKNEFYLLAIIIGFVQGGIQALSRSLFARLIPKDKSAEYFGFYNMLGKFAVILGPVLIGSVGLFARSLGFSSSIASRLSITSVSILFLTGGILLFFVDEKKIGKETGYHSSESETGVA